MHSDKYFLKDTGAYLVNELFSFCLVNRYPVRIAVGIQCIGWPIDYINDTAGKWVRSTGALNGSVTLNPTSP